MLASGRGKVGLHFVVGEQIHQKGESELPLAVHFLNPCILKRSPAAARSIAKQCLCSIAKHCLYDIANVKVLPSIAFVAFDRVAHEQQATTWRLSLCCFLSNMRFSDRLFLWILDLVNLSLSVSLLSVFLLPFFFSAYVLGVWASTDDVVFLHNHLRPIVALLLLQFEIIWRWPLLLILVFIWNFFLGPLYLKSTSLDARWCCFLHNHSSAYCCLSYNGHFMLSYALSSSKYKLDTKCICISSVGEQPLYHIASL